MSPISVPQVGRPEMKLLVPSIGSSTQTYSASGRSLTIFLADDAMRGKGLGDQPPHRGLGAAVGLGDRIEHAAPRLVLGADGRTAEERKNHLARDLREVVDEAGEIDCGHADRSKKAESSSASAAYLPCPIHLRGMPPSAQTIASRKSLYRMTVIGFGRLCSVPKSECSKSPHQPAAPHAAEENVLHYCVRNARYCCGAA